MKISVNLLCWGKRCLSPIYVLKDAEVSHFIWKEVVVFGTAERCIVSSVDFRQVTQDRFIVNILRGTLRTSAFEGAGTEHAGLNSSPICVTFWQGRAVALRLYPVPMNRGVFGLHDTALDTKLIWSSDRG